MGPYSVDMIVRVSWFLVVAFAALTGLQCTASQDIDFRNFTYPFPNEKFHPVPDKLAWMNLKMNSSVTLSMLDTTSIAMTPLEDLR
jgi:hypothetical protein